MTISALLSNNCGIDLIPTTHASSRNRVPILYQLPEVAQRSAFLLPSPSTLTHSLYVLHLIHHDVREAAFNGHSLPHTLCPLLRCRRPGWTVLVHRVLDALGHLRVVPGQVGWRVGVLPLVKDAKLPAR